MVHTRNPPVAEITTQRTTGEGGRKLGDGTVLQIANDSSNNLGTAINVNDMIRDLELHLDTVRTVRSHNNNIIMGLV